MDDNAIVMPVDDIDCSIGKKAVIYSRYSSDKQDEASIEAQMMSCQEYALKNGYTIVHTYADEAISGKQSKTKKRLQYQRMLRDAEAGKFALILIHKYDRVARSVQEHFNLAARLSSAHVELVAVAEDFGTSKTAKFMRVLMWALSELYIDNLAEETRKGHKVTAMHARHNGGYAPFGYDVVDQQYVINELEATYVRRMFDACIRGTKYNDLLDEMHVAGITGKRGRPMGYPSIYEILRNEKYTGVYIYSVEQSKDRVNRRHKPDAIRIEDALPAIVSRETWERVQQIMDSNKNNGRRPKTEYLLSGRIFCADCGAPMYGVTTARKGHEYHYYLCSKKCGNRSIRVEDANDYVYAYLSELLTDKNQSILQDTLKQYTKQLQVKSIYDAEKLNHEIADRQKQIDALMANMAASVLPPPVVESMGKKMAELQAQISALQTEKDRPVSVPQHQVKKYFEAISNLKDQSEDVRRNAIRYFIDRVEIARNAVNVTSTFTAFLENIGCGGGI